MGHEVCFENVENRWSSALPLGNGKLGAMVFFEKNALHVALNDYDVYYAGLPRDGGPELPEEGAYQKACEAARRSRCMSEKHRTHYVTTLHPRAAGTRPQFSTACQPASGELCLFLSPAMQDADTRLWLDIEKATVYFCAAKDGLEVRARVLVCKTEQAVLVCAEESSVGLWQTARLLLPQGKGMEQYSHEIMAGPGQQRIFQQIGESKTAETLAAADSAQTLPEGELLGDSPCKTIWLTVGTEPGQADWKLDAVRGQSAKREQEHLRAWSECRRSRVELPDKVLETLWHYYLYILECCAGGGRYARQACGLNGLWDIRRPTMWGSMWYWDVNIQEAFWPVFAANQLDLGRVFCEGYLGFAQDVREFARRAYGMEGMALDAPHLLYNCIQPWCAQFLWEYYRYSGDIAFLQQKAYPVFLEQIHFLEQVAHHDEKDVLHIDPDISPEQGPVTRDSVITISCLRRLLTNADEAAGLLGRPEEERERFRALRDALPDYLCTADGERWKDSALAPDGLFLRHPSVLMPIFPAGQVSMHSEPEHKRLAWNTLRYAQDHTERGMFGAGWIASAAARMGEGSAAVRVLYRQLLDWFMHQNGLCYEESERGINFCIVSKQPLRLPAMMEPCGGVPSAVNEMLLQAFDGVLRIFPALPNGQDALEVRPTRYLDDDEAAAEHAADWKDCAFYDLLAPGGVEVSAQRKDGRTVWICLHALRDTECTLEFPAELADCAAQTLTLRLHKGERQSFGQKAEEQPVGASGVLRWQTVHGRRLALGADRHSAYYRAVDSFTCPYSLANHLQYPATPKILDLTAQTGPKCYDDAYPRQYSDLEVQPLQYAAGPVPFGLERYDTARGYGWKDTQGITLEERQGPDALRRDFACGQEPAELWIDLPAGKYDLLLVCGDEELPSSTRVILPAQGTADGGTLCRAGRYQCSVLPVVHPDDGPLRIRLESTEAAGWRLNAVFVNKQYTAL